MCSKFWYTILILWAFCAFSLVAAPKEKPKAELDSVAFHGAFLSVDVVSAAQMALGQNGKLEAQLDVNLYNRFQPAVEFGYAAFDYSKQDNARSYGQGYYAKIGLDLPISKYGPHADNQYFGSVRYAYGITHYHLENVPFPASYWGDAYEMNFRDQHAGAHWVEFGGGTRIQVAGPISLGWTLLLKKKLSVQEASHSRPAYIAGYGPYRDTNYSFSLNFYYLLPIKR